MSSYVIFQEFPNILSLNSTKSPTPAERVLEKYPESFSFKENNSLYRLIGNGFINLDEAIAHLFKEGYRELVFFFPIYCGKLTRSERISEHDWHIMCDNVKSRYHFVVYDGDYFSENNQHPLWIAYQKSFLQT